MMGKKVGAQQRPTIQGLMLQNSSYGRVIPRVLGMTKATVNTIWANGLREGDSGKKGKKSAKKGAPPTYVCNIDFLLGSNPIAATLRWWVNATPAANNTYGLNFVNHSFAVPFGTNVTLHIDPTGSPSSTRYIDPNFYCVVAVTVVFNGYSYTFNDYGGDGSRTLTGNMEFPLWNACQSGPDPIDDYGWRKAPYTYYNLPFSGAVQLLDPNSLFLPNQSPVVGAAAIKVYYAQLINGKVPIAALRCAFESTLGSGSEYVGYSSQQIQYPQFAGCGSPDIDLGSGPAIPNLKPEVLGAYPYYYTGDCDFADMIEDICKMGQSQADIANNAYQFIQYGASLSEYPGAVQKMNLSGLEGFTASGVKYPRPNTAGNILIAAGSCGGQPPTITDDAVNTWTHLWLTTNVGWNVAYATNCLASNGNTVHFAIAGSPSGNDWDEEIYEFADLDTIDGTPQALTGTVPGGPATTVAFNVTTTNKQGEPAYIFIYLRVPPGNSQPTMLQRNLWKPLISNKNSYYGIFSPVNANSYYRVVWSPGTYTFNVTFQGGTSYAVGIIAMKNSNPPAFPKPLGDILDKTTLEQCRMQCQANGLWGSLYMDSQRKASEWMTEIYEAMNAWPLYSGFKLKSVARSEVSAVGNGAAYTAMTANGPVANLKPEDHIGNKSEPLIKVKRRAASDSENLIQIQHPDRNNNYNPALTSQPNNGAIAIRGTKKKSPKSLPCVQDTTIGRALLGIAVRRETTLLNVYSGKLQAKMGLLEAGDLVTLTDPLVGINALPVRLTKVNEDEKFNLDYEAEDFMYGLNAPVPLSGTSAQGTGVDTTTVPAVVNTPIIFQPPQALTLDSQPETWFVVSDNDPVYGGCVVYVSIDNGASYDAIGMIKGNSATGFTTADWPQHIDPDTTNDLPVDLTESLETLASYSVAQEDSLAFPCYVEVPTPYCYQNNHATGLTNAFASANLVGSALVVIARVNTGGGGGAATFTCSDSAGNTYTQIQYDTTGSYSIAVFLALNANAGANTVSVVATPGGTVDTLIMEFPRILTAGAFDQQQAIHGTPPTTLTPTITPTQAVEFLVSWGELTGSGTVDQDSSWATIYNDGSTSAFMKTVRIGGAQSNTIQFTSGVNQTFAGIFSLKFYTTAVMPYELMAYGVATLTSANHYTLKATGGGNKLRRAIYGTWLDSADPNVGPEHVINSRFAFLNPTGAGILKIVTPPAWIGKNLLFKFVQFNNFFSGYGDLTTATAYAYTTTAGNGSVGGGIGGGGGNSSYTITPSPALSQPSSTQINMLQCQAHFVPSGLNTNYNARTFTIPDPGGTPTLYYVTVYDPSLTGDSGTSTNLTAYCTTSQITSHWNDAGYIRIGTMTAVHGGGGVGGGGGSTPPPATVSTVGITIDGGGSTPTTGSKGYIQVPFAATIVGWTLIADQTGSAQITVKKCADGTFPTTVSIDGTTPPALVAAQKVESADLSAWTNITVAVNDIFEFNLDSVTTCQRLILELKLMRT